ncbi:response regulator [Rhodospirillales bacterium]|nr:response regulator [Rhodospirillales bacterium]
MRILVVDDDKFAMRAMARPLRMAGYEVVEAMKPEQVIKAAEAGQFKIAIVDIFIPGMGGIEMIQRIRASSPACKIVAVSAGYADMPGSDAIQAAIKIGADLGYIKPVDMDALLKNIRDWKDQA